MNWLQKISGVTVLWHATTPKNAEGILHDQAIKPNFVQILKIYDVRDKIDSWFFMPTDGQPRIDRDESASVKSQLRDQRFDLLEDLFQQWNKIDDEIRRKET